MRGEKPRYYLYIVKRCLQLQAVNLWVSGGEDGSKYSLGATLSSLFLSCILFPPLVSRLFSRSTAYPSRSDQHHPLHRGIPIYPFASFHPDRTRQDWIEHVQNENIQLIMLRKAKTDRYFFFFITNSFKNAPTQKTFQIFECIIFLFPKLKNLIAKV